MSDRTVSVIPPQNSLVSTSSAVVATTSIAIASSSSSTSAAIKTNSTESAAAPVSTVDTAPMKFEVVSTAAAQEQGLGGRAVIPDNYAMLFVFPQDGSYGFWMKDMLTSIDMIWLTDNGTIAGIQEDATAASYPDVFYPPYPIRYVLETRVGLAKERGWTVGTKVQLPLPYGE